MIRSALAALLCVVALCACHRETEPPLPPPPTPQVTVDEAARQADALAEQIRRSDRNDPDRPAASKSGAESL